MAEMSKEDVLNEYLTLFRASAKLFLKADFEKPQKKEIQEIYRYSFIGLLREGYERKLLNENGKELILINVDGAPYAMQTVHLKQTLGEEYQKVVKVAQEKDIPDSEIVEELPEYYEEGEAKNATDFVYAAYNAEVVSKEDGEIGKYVFHVYPERIPRNFSDKIKTVVTVKGERNAVYIGNVGTTTRFKLGTIEIGAKCEVDKKTGSLICKTVVLSGTDTHEAYIEKIKDFDATEGTRRNSHMIVKITGKEVHVFPMDYGNNDSNGCAESVALIGEERIALIPANNNVIPVTAEDNSRTNVRFFWRKDALFYEI